MATAKTTISLEIPQADRLRRIKHELSLKAEKNLSMTDVVVELLRTYDTCQEKRQAS